MNRRIFLVLGTLALLMLALMAAPASAEGEEAVEGSRDTALPGGCRQGAMGVDFTSCLMDNLSGGPRMVLLGRQNMVSGPPSPGGAPVTAAVRQVAPAGVPFRDPAPAFSRNILISREFGVPIQTEPSIAVDPKDPDHLVMSTIDYNFPGNSTYVSIDGGATWGGPFQNRYVRDDVSGAGDPVVAFDSKGDVYTVGLSLGFEEFSIGPLVTFFDISAISLTKSTDGGYTWSEPIDTARAKVTSNTRIDAQGFVRGTVTIEFLDKEWIAVGKDPGNPENEVIYVTYTNFEQTANIFYIGEAPFLGVPTLRTTIKLVRSTDGGKTWSAPVNVSPTVVQTYGTAGSQQDVAGRRIVQGSQPKVAPDGTVYVAWMDSTDDESQKGIGEIYVARSDNAGRTFRTPVKAATIKEPSYTPRTARFRYWATVFPQIAVGPQGEVYVMYGAIPNSTGPDDPKRRDDGDIFFVRSTDKGVTFSGTPTPVNGDDTSRLQFYPSIAVSPNGTIHAMWGDMRDDPNEMEYHIYYTTSTDQGKTWGFDLPQLNLHTPDTRVSDAPSNPNRAFPGGQFIGDYFSIAASDKDVYMVWADSRLGAVTGTDQRIGFARQRAIDTPQVFLNPPSGPGGRTVTVQGFNFQPDTEYFIEVSGVAVQANRTNQKGEFTSGIFVPISGEGPHDIRIFDISGNLATASFFMSFGFDTMQKQQENTLRQIQSLSGRPVAAGTATAAAAVTATPAKASGGCGLAPGAPAEAAFVLGVPALALVFWRRRR